VFDHRAYTEKSLARMAKAKAKSERAAARLAAQSKATGEGSGTNTPSVEREVSPAPGAESQTQDPDEAAAEATPPVDSTTNRLMMLREKSAVVARFMQLLVPILIDVYAASVITPIRMKTLTGLLKAVNFLDGDGIRRVLAVRFPVHFGVSYI